MRKKLKKPVVQLTSLLDLLFVMIFVLLLQSKAAPSKDTAKKDPPPPKPVAQTPAPAKPVPKKPVPKKPAPRNIFVDAVFHFYATASSPSVPSGMYGMNGNLDTKTGQLALYGTEWIKDPPPGFEMVPLRGVIDEKKGTFTGRIQFQDCEEFTLRRVSRGGGSPVAGEWEGAYTCGQGETGLTLTLK